MPDRGGYGSFLSRESVAFVAQLPKRQQRQVLDLADQIARQPFQIGDYPTVDAVGRRIESRVKGMIGKGQVLCICIDC